MRTWDDNRQAINQLWPLMTFTDEEKRLWHDDLAGLNQDVLYDAIRNVKRANDSNYPHIKWVREEYRGLERLSKFASRKTVDGEPRQVVKIDADKNAKMRDELKAAIECATAADFDSMLALIADKASNYEIELATGYRLVRYLLERLGMANGNVYGGAA